MLLFIRTLRVTGLLFLVVPILDATPQPARNINIQVKKTPPHIERRLFNLAHPAPGQPELQPPEAGLCEYTFQCHSDVEAAFPVVTWPKAGATISSATITLRLDITIWTLPDSGAKVAAHEEGHRRIAEIYYQSADAIVRRLATTAIRQKIPLSGTDARSAATRALKVWQDDLLQSYLTAVATPCEVTQDRYDAITEHSLNATPEDAAIAEVMTESPAARAAASAPGAGAVR